MRNSLRVLPSSICTFSTSARRMASSRTGDAGKAPRRQPKDMAHHINKRVLNQAPSAMKAYGALADSKPGLTSLAGGLPDPNFFPLQHAQFTLPSFSSLSDVNSAMAGPAAAIDLDKSGDGPGPAGLMDLRTVLQYGLTKSYPQLVDRLIALNELLHGVPHSESAVTATLGNTDGVSKAMTLLVEDGDIVLAEEFEFPASVNAGRAKGATFAPVPLDSEGIVPEALDRILSEWDSKKGKKPHVLLTTPCGQNPTGCVSTPERMDAVYAVAQKHDLVIIEDDPYFPLQYAEYTSDASKRSENLAKARDSLPPLPSTPEKDDARAVAEAFKAHAGVESYLKRDVDGRVVRLDSFSKVFGPGIRLGWASASQQFVERLWRIGEVTTQTPNNMTQALLASYLAEPSAIAAAAGGAAPEQGGWGLAGWLRWLHALRLSYEAKRDFFLDAFYRHVPQDIISTVPARGGMFQWLSVDLSKHPRYDGSNTRELIDELAESLMDAGVLVMPARLFVVESVPGERNDEKLAAFRATFAGSEETIDKGLKLFGDEIRRWFAEGAKK